MPLRQFSLPINVGVDICHVYRIRKILTKANQDSLKLNRFLRRFLSLHEQQDFYNRFGRYKFNATEIDRISKHLAGRWSAKEATIKAVSWRRLSFLDIHIGTLPNRQDVVAVILDQPAPASGLTPRAFAGEEAGRSEESSAPLIKTTIPSAHLRDLDSPPCSDDLDSSQKVAMVEMEFEITKLSGHIAQISISHDGDYATAVCLAVQESPSTTDGQGTPTAYHQTSRAA